MSFEERIKNWVEIDNQIKERTAELRELRDMRSQHQEQILDHVATNNLAHKTVQITDGILRFQNNKITSPLTFKFITRCLNDCISDEQQVKLLVDYIRKNRDVRYVPEVKRSYK